MRFFFSYNICIRQEDGYCCVRYSLCGDSQSFSIDNTAATVAAEAGTQCSEDWVGISGAMSTCAGTTSNTAQVNKLCGGFLSAMAGSVAQPAYICGKNYVKVAFNFFDYVEYPCSVC